MIKTDTEKNHELNHDILNELPTNISVMHIYS